MKKLVSTLALLLPVVVAMAQTTTSSHWTAKTSFDYDNATLVACQVFINGSQAKSGLEVAAFVGDECRADATSPSGESNIYSLRVVGKETSATITFKAYYNGIEYDFTKKIENWNFTTEQEQTYSEIPFILYLDVITGVKIDSPVEVTVKKADLKDGKEVDYTSKVSYVYGGDAARGTSTYTPKNQSTPAGTYSISLKTGSQVSSDYISIDGKKVTIKKVTDNAISGTPDEYTILALLNYQGPKDRQPAVKSSAQSTLKVKYEKTLMTKLMYKGSTEAFTIDRFYAYDDLFAEIDKHITYEPAEPDYPGWKFEEVKKDGQPYGEIMLPEEGGSYTFTLKPETADENCVYPQGCTVKVYVRPAAISKKERISEPLGIKVGDNVKDAVEGNIEFTWRDGKVPDDAWAAKELEYTYSPAEAVNANNIAVATGSLSATAKLKDGVTLLPTSQEPGTSELTFSLDVTSSLSLTWSLQTKDFYKTGAPSDDVLAKVTVVNPNGETFDKDQIIATFLANRYNGVVSPYAEMAGVVFDSEDTQNKTTIYNVFINPLYVGTDIQFELKYNGEPFYWSGQEADQDKINITEKQSLGSGWTWIALNTYKEGGIKVSEACNMTDIIEGRSQLQLFYNDATIGLFGDLTTLSSAGGTYKIRTNKATSITLGNQNAFENPEGASVTIKKGYNWMGNPYEFDMDGSRISEFLNGFTPQEGDKIMTQANGFAEYNSGAWSFDGQTFKLEAGKGIVYYTTGEGSFTFDHTLLPAVNPGGEAKERAAAHRHEVFTYNPHAFADNMAMVAELNGLQNPEQYTIGVFVGDECRGNGNAVKDNIFFISATGKSGEKLTFRLYDNFSGEYFDIDEVGSFTLINGSLSSPVMLSAPTATGVQTLSEARAFAEGQNAEELGVRSYNTNGQIVDDTYKGIVIKNGRKYLNK